MWISGFFNNHRTSIARKLVCPPTFESSWLQSWCALLVLAEVKEGSYKRVCKKVRTSACARRFVRACVQEGSYGRVCKKVRTSLVLKKSRLISDFFNNHRTSIARKLVCPPTFASSWLQSWCALLVLAEVQEGSYERACKKVRTSSVLKESMLISYSFNNHCMSIVCAWGAPPTFESSWLHS